MAQHCAQAETWKNQVIKAEQEKQQLAQQNAQAILANQQMQQQLVQQNAQANQANQEMQQQMERWKTETLKSQKLQRENVERCTILEAQLRAAQERLLSADSGDSQLKNIVIITSR